MLSYNYSNSVRTNSVERKWAKDFFCVWLGKGYHSVFSPRPTNFSTLCCHRMCIFRCTPLVGAAAQALLFCLSAPPIPPITEALYSHTCYLNFSAAAAAHRQTERERSYVVGKWALQLQLL